MAARRIKWRLTPFVGRLVRSDVHLGADLANDGVECGSNSEVWCAADRYAPRWAVMMPDNCIDGLIHPNFGDQVPAFFGNEKLQQFSFGINEPGIGL